MAVYKREVAFCKWSDRVSAQYQNVNEKLNGMVVDGYGRMNKYPQPPRNSTERPVVAADIQDGVSYLTYDAIGDTPVVVFRIMEEV